ncbi:phosphoadenosine phosphosulfate reductase domain-containing protein [Gemmata sp.]|uniref:phosphoadenosine phosphosulfate reductase domain-containing protein n=1 Tax=Gemmata sp. TaxID=1914242 RepID=UPI003F71DA87
MKPLPTIAETETPRGIATAPEVDRLLAVGSPVAIGVSGGKDSSAVALATVAHLDRIGHAGPRTLVHADLGATEWADSLPTCRRLADRLGLELLVVRRRQGDMMDRWEQRWRDNVARWEALSCVKLILPWSTPAMRFCTAELKVDQITRALCKRYSGCHILNVTGIRRAESTERAKAPVAKAQPKLTSVTHGTAGTDWHPIIDWSTPDVFAYAAEQNFPLHEAYTRFGASRVSCVWCILATVADHKAGARDERNLALARRMADLETRSTFAFQGSRWLGDTLAVHLSDETRGRLAAAKERAKVREGAEARIPKHLLYTKNWPTGVPTPPEAELIAEVRVAVADAVGLERTFCEPSAIIGRYEQLLREKHARDGKKAKPRLAA